MGRRVPTPEPRHGLPMKLAGLAVVRLVLESVHLDAESRVLVRGLHFLWLVKLKLLREACVGERLAYRALNRGQCVVSCWVTRCWDGMVVLAGCWS